jgi:uncharacterized protein YggE
MSTVEVGGKEFKDVVFEAMKRSAADPEFRGLALRDGNAALKKINPSLALSQGAIIKFHEKSAGNQPPIIMNFPLPSATDEELSAEELEQVAGGSVSATSIKVTTA